MGVLVLVIGFLVLWLAMRLVRSPGIRRYAATLLFVVCPIALTVGGYWTWFTHRGQPAPLLEQWFQGISYERVVVQSPRILVVHIVRVDIRAPGIELVFTPVPTATDLPLKAASVSTFLRESKSQVAINANFFYPFSAASPLSYYPHEGDPVQVAGIAAYQGLVYQPYPFEAPSDPAATLYVSEDGRPSFSPPADAPYNAISGSAFLLRDGKIVTATKTIEPPLYPRAAVGLDESGSTLILAVLDGKQPSYSLGATLPEFAELLVRAGAFTAINLDGGGSSTLVRQAGGANAARILVSSPSNFRMPWWERPVANHLGIKATALPQ